MDQWTALVTGSASIDDYDSAPRRELLYGMDYLDGNANWTGYDTAAIRLDSWKLLINTYNSTWWAPPKSNEVWQYEIDESSVHTFLFNLDEDPYETTDLKDKYPAKVDELMGRLAEYRGTMVSSVYCFYNDLAGYWLMNKTGFITPWVAQHDYLCPFRFTKEGVKEYSFNPAKVDGKL